MKSLEKFKLTFISKIKEIETKLKIKNAIKIVAKDCPREKIWRNKIFVKFYYQN